MKKSILTLIAFVLCVSSISFAADAGRLAHVYFYREHAYKGSALKPSVFCDDTQLARMENGRYFSINVPAGEHTFYANGPKDRQSGENIDLESGKSYYLRLSLDWGLWKGHGRLTQIAPEEAQKAIHKLKPMEREKIMEDTYPIYRPSAQ
ncbi:MAG: DUF2846 domain-containing protein [Acidobacteriaceae bacterium]